MHFLSGLQKKLLELSLKYHEKCANEENFIE